MNAPLGFCAALPGELIHGALETVRALGVEVASPGGDVAWNVVATALNARADLVDERFARRFAGRYAGQSGLLQLGARLGLSPRGFAELIARATAAFPLCLVSTCRVGPRQLSLSLRLVDGLSPCLPFWRLVHASLTHAPVAVGQPPLHAASTCVSPVGLDVCWTLPPPRAQARVVPTTLSQLVPLLAGLELADDTAKPDGDALGLQRELGLTRAEARIALRIASGLTPRETAEELRIAYETVRTHLRNINQRLALSSQRELVDLVERWRLSRRGRAPCA